MSPAAARPVVCQQRCTALSSCVYLQYERDTCWLCSNAADDVTAEQGLTSAASQVLLTHVKTGIENVIFASSPSQDCTGSLMEGAPSSVGGQPFSETATAGSNLTKITFCSTNWRDFYNKITGFQLYFGPSDQRLVGCGTDPRL